MLASYDTAKLTSKQAQVGVTQVLTYLCLRGSCSPHPANDEKRYVLYKKFWGLLNDVGLWKDNDYLSRKEEKTVRDDKRDVMPDCVIKVIINILETYSCVTYLILIIGNTKKISKS